MNTAQKTYPETKINLIEIQPQNPRPSTWIFCRFGITEMANIGPSTPMGLESICLPEPFPIASVLYEASRATCKLDVASEAGLGWMLVLTQQLITMKKKPNHHLQLVCHSTWHVVMEVGCLQSHGWDVYHQIKPWTSGR